MYNNFLEIANKQQRNFFLNLYLDCLEKKIPIIKRDVQLFLFDFFKDKEINNIIEIGTAVGFSAMYLSNILHSNIISIEKNEKSYKESLKNLYFYPNFYNKKINFINYDAINVDLNNKHIFTENNYDLIFIDASKKNNQIFFEKFKHLLNENGYIITDNINFNNLIFKNIKDVEKRLQPIVKSILQYRKFLLEHLEFETIFYNVGDGIAITKRKNN